MALTSCKECCGKFSPRSFSALYFEQVTACLDTGPLMVGGANVQEITSATLGGGCSTVIVADVKARSVITSVHCGLGQSGAPVIGLGDGGLVVTLNGVLPFLISEAGIDCGVADTATGAGLCPGGCVCPAGLVQVATGLATAVIPITISWKPSPASSPTAVNVRPLSVNDGPDLT